MYECYLEYPLEQYLASAIMPITAEIDEIGLRALVQGVIEPSNIAVEVVYLDLSQGSEANIHAISNNPNPVYTIRLLYRP